MIPINILHFERVQKYENQNEVVNDLGLAQIIFFFFCYTLFFENCLHLTFREKYQNYTYEAPFYYRINTLFMQIYIYIYIYTDLCINYFLLKIGSTIRNSPENYRGPNF